MRYFLLVGEASGDLHAARLMQEIKRLDPDAVFAGLGGDRMIAEGLRAVLHIRELAFMGFSEVIRHLPQILRNFSRCKKEILAFQPDCVIPVDYPGFNLRLLPFLKKNKCKVVYYISPQLWAWHVSRVKIIKEYVDKMIVIFPFEEAFYQKYGVKAHYVGHPLLDNPDMTAADLPKKYIALLPGSRQQEIIRILPVMLQTADFFPDLRFEIAGVDWLGKSFYTPLMKNRKNVGLQFNRTAEILKQSDAALVTSGTATLETALLGVPQIVCYKASPISYFLGKKLVRVPFISIVNLIAEKEMVPERVQQQCTADMLRNDLQKILSPAVSDAMKKEYLHLREILGSKGASEKAAKIIVFGNG